MEKIIREALVPWKTYWKHGEQFQSSEADPKHAQKMAEDEGPPKVMMDILQKITKKMGWRRLIQSQQTTTTST